MTLIVCSLRQRETVGHSRNRNFLPSYFGIDTILSEWGLRAALQKKALF
jgi:hypothetical protein